MRIEILNGGAIITVSAPVFIGSTSDKGDFPPAGEPLRDFCFQPEKGCSGTLVFDHSNSAERTGRTPSFLHFYWKDGKLIVKKGRLQQWNHRRADGFNSKHGMWYFNPHDSCMFHTGEAFDSVCLDDTTLQVKVTMLDMLMFLEEKITSEQLRRRAIK